LLAAGLVVVPVGEEAMTRRVILRRGRFVPAAAAGAGIVRGSVADVAFTEARLNRSAA
jgi:hypothetical protein